MNNKRHSVQMVVRATGINQGQGKKVRVRDRASRTIVVSLWDMRRVVSSMCYRAFLPVRAGGADERSKVKTVKTSEERVIPRQRIEEKCEGDKKRTRSEKRSNRRGMGAIEEEKKKEKEERKRKAKV